MFTCAQAACVEMLTAFLVIRKSLSVCSINYIHMSPMTKAMTELYLHTPQDELHT